MKTPARAPQHRYSRLQVKASDRAYHVSRVIRAVVVLDELLAAMRWLRPGTYEISPGVVSKAKATESKSKSKSIINSYTHFS